MIALKRKPKPFDVIAVGDIHATYEPYRQFLDWVEGTQAIVVVLGDMIDRGKEDLIVLECTRIRLENPERYGLGGFYALRGNHEQMFLNAAFDGIAPFRTTTLEWLKNGGNFEDMFEMVDLHAEWLWKLPIYMTIDDTLFIHAGVFPGQDPAKTVGNGKVEDLLWVREPFLRFGPQFEKWNPNLKRVVHGHTPTCFETHNKEKELGFAPVVTEDRVNIDTGACFGDEGHLTAYNVTQNTFHHFYN